MANYQGGYGAPPASQEPVFFSSPQAYVSRSRVVLNGVTFPVNGITAVYSRKKPKSLFGLILGIFCALSSFVFCGPGVVGLTSGDDTRSIGIGCTSIGFCDFALGVGLVAVFIWIQKVEYVLVISTAGREMTAIVHTDWHYVSAIVDAINQALASRT